jgi:hypothetical protein
MGSHISENVYEHDDGQQFCTGCMPPKHDDKVCAYAPRVEYTRSQIEQKIKAGRGNLAAWVVAVMNQTQHPWCWAFMGSGILMSKLWLAGYEKVILDPTLGPLATGVNGGNSIDAMISEVQVPFGQVTASYSSNNPVSGDISTRRIPREWKAEAAKRKVVKEQWQKLPDVLALAAELIEGHPCGWGVDWQGGGHALQVMEVVTADDGQLELRGPNTWGMSYSSGYRALPGRPGWYCIKENDVSDCWDGAGYGAYSLSGALDNAV